MNGQNFDVSVRLSTVGQNEVSANLKSIQGVMSGMAAGLNETDIGGKRLSATFKQTDADGNKLSVTMRQLADSNQMVRNTFVDVNASSSGFGETLSAAAGKLALLGVSAGAAIAGLKAFVLGGLEMNDVLEQSQIKLSIVLESLYKYPGATSQSAAATADAAAQIEALKGRSLEVLGPLQDLLALNQRLAPAMNAAGVASAQQATDFSILMAKVADVSGQNYEQVAMQMSRLITTGQMARGEFAQTLRGMGITPDIIASWKAMGTTIDGQSVLVMNLSEKLKAYGERQAELLQTHEGAWKQLSKTIQETMRDALAGTEIELTKRLTGWRDLILAKKDEIRDAAEAIFGTIGTLLKTQAGIWASLVRTALGGIFDDFKKSADDAGLTVGQRLGVAIVDVGKALNQTQLIAADFLATLKIVRDMSFAPLAAALLIPATAITLLVNALAFVSGDEKMKAWAETADAALGKLAAAVVAPVKDVMSLSAAFAENKKRADDASLSLDHLASKIKLGDLDKALRGEFAMDTDVARTPGPLPQPKAWEAAFDAAIKAVGEFQAKLTGLGSGPATDAIGKIFEEFGKLEVRISTLAGVLSKAHMPATFIEAVTGYLQILAQTWEQSKLEEKLTEFREKLTVGLADLDAKWQAAGSAEAAYAEQVKGLAGLDATERAMKDQAAAIATATETLTGGLIPAWAVFSTLMEQIQPKLDAARDRLLKLTGLNIQESLARSSEDWTSYLDIVYQKNLLAGQNVTEAWQNALNSTSGEMVKSADTVEKGLAAGLAKFQASLGTEGKDIADGIDKLGNSLTGTLSSSFFDVMTGKLSNLGTDFKKFGEDILKNLSDVFAKILERWLLVALGVSANPLQASATGGRGLGLGGNAPGPENVGGSSIVMAGGGFMPQGGTGGAAGMGAWGGYLGSAGIIGGAFASGNTAAGVGGIAGLAVGVLAPAVITGLVSGIGAGAIAGSVVPIVGTIIGAIIGAVLGALFKSSTEIKVYGSSFMPQIETVAHNLQAGILDVYASSLLKDTAGFAGGMNDVIAKYLARAGGFQVAAGSSEDVQGDIQRLLTGVIPTELLHLLMGQQRTGGQDMAGISGASTYGGQLDPNAPINKMLTDLGFTATKIQWLAGQIDQMKPEDWIKQLNLFVSTVATGVEASKKLGRSFAEISADQATKAAQSPAAAIADSVQTLVDEARTLALYTGADQAQRASDWLTKVQQVIAAEEQAIAQLNAMIVAIGDQQKALHVAVDAALRSPAEQLAFITAKLPGDFEAIMAAANPTDLQKAWNTFLSDTTTVVNSLVARIQTIESLQQAVSAFFASVVAGPGADPTKNPFAYLVQNARQIQSVTESMQKATGDQQVAYAQQLLGLLQQRYAFELQKLQEVNDAIASIGTSIQDQIFGLEQKGRTPHEQGVAMWDQVQKLYGQLAGAQSPQEVTSIVSRIQQLIGQLAQQPQDPAHAAEATQILVDMLKKTQTEADRVLNLMGATLQADIAKLPEQINTIVTTLAGALQTAQTDLTKTLTTFDSAAAAATGKLTAFGDALTAEVAPLQAAVDAVVASLTGLSAAIDKVTNPPNPPPTSDKDKPPVPGANIKTGAGGAPTNGGGSGISIDVNVKSGSPQEIADTVSANVIVVLKQWMIDTLQRHDVALVTYLRQHPELLTGKT